MTDPLELFFKDLLVENNADCTDVIIAFDNASPELPLKALLQKRTRDDESFNWSFTSIDSRSSRWDSIPNLGGTTPSHDSNDGSSKAKREGVPSLPRRTLEKEPVLLELMALAADKCPLIHERLD